ncbi:transcription initiation factor IIB family protein [Natrinema sp. SYSU A 869]|uniref:transcription initiation factor IIB n=1 Tax=Natrinema sp. SYSU A 869 TaxID=2871694 RepID=UPI001CA3B87B|nr:transcription initiation factor IIB family protein [Natrinema sp. SYSU A 869]
MSSRQQSTAERVESETTSTDEPSICDADKVSADEFDTTSTCVECGEQSFTQSKAGEWYCDSCGAVHTGTELERSEPGWTPRDQRRTGPATSITRVSVGTKIGHDGNAEASFWAQYNTRLSHENQTLRHGLRELRALANALEATETLTEQSAYRFRRAAEKGLLVGHSLEAMAAACIHVTAREHHVPFPLQQIADVSPVDLDDIKTTVSKLLREFDLQVAPPLPTAFLERFASEVDLSNEIRRRALQLADAMIEDGEHVGQSPTGFAAAILYGAAKDCEVDITQKELASIAFVSVVTLSRQWQTVQTYLDNA